MPLYKKFYNKNIVLKYYPEENTLSIQPKKGASKHDLRSFKEELQIFLDVKSSNFTSENGRPVFTIKLGNTANPVGVEEFLKQKLHGGDEVEDPATMAAPEEEQQPPPAPQQQPPAPEMPPEDQSMVPQEEEGLPMESISFSSLYQILGESTYRTAKYWEVLARAAGKGKQALDEKNVLSLRREYSRKPKSKNRNEVLRSLDDAMQYFFKKLKKYQGPAAAEDYKKKYRAIGDLVPSDYKDGEQGKEIEKAESSPFDMPEVEKVLDFQEFFRKEDEEENDEEEAFEKYDKFETES